MAKIILKSYDEINKSRKKSRIILVLFSLPFIIAIALFSMKAFTMYSGAEQTINVYKKGDFVKSVELAKDQEVNNFFEPWLAYYNLGTSYAAQKDYSESEAKLLQALEIVGNNLNQCYIRSNLSIVYEAQGDIFTKNGDTINAKQRYALVKKVIYDAPKDCFPPSSSDGKSSEKSELSKTGEQMDETKKRVEGKESESSGEKDDSSSPTPSSEEEEEGEGDVQEIQEQIDQSNTDRTSKENSERGGSDQSSEKVAKPW